MSWVRLSERDIEALYSEGAGAKDPFVAVRQMVDAARRPGGLEPGTDPAYALAVAADLCAYAGDVEQALALLTEAIEFDGGQDKAPVHRLAAMAQLLVKSGQRAEGLALLESLRPYLGTEPSANMSIVDALLETEQEDVAIEWLTDAIQRQLRTPLDSHAAMEHTVLLNMRRRIRHQMGLSPDALDLAAPADPALPFDSALAPPSFRGNDDWDEEIDDDVLRLLYWPEHEYALLLTRWPGLAEEFGADWASQRNAVKKDCAESLAEGPVQVVPGEVEEYAIFAAKHALDPAIVGTGDRYLYELTRQGRGIDYPPARNATCWCGSGSKYKKCCGFG
jgi:tetratricopeptide (TPR) repeat protein